MKLLQINTTVNSGSTGRIAEEIGKLVMEHGHESFIAYGRGNRPSASKIIKIGDKRSISTHVLITRLLDLHGFGSTKATKAFINELKKADPDIIHLHNIHGYFLNVEVLFEYLKEANRPVVWTFHDCWPFTGHCSYFDFVNCFKWKKTCYKCPNIKAYPASWFRDNSRNNFQRKKRLFTSLKNLTIVTPSHWLADHTRKSFFNDVPVRVIHNGIDMKIFKPAEVSNAGNIHHLDSEVFILGVANVWGARKGLKDFLCLRKMLPKEIGIVLIGLNKKQISDLPEGITGIARTESVAELATYYSAASVFVNPTYVDNFPTTNLEALACGTPVVTYNTGGSPEAVDAHTGLVVEKGDVKGLAEAIKTIINKGKEHYTSPCRARAERYFNKDDRFMDYLRLYEKLTL